MILFPIYGSKDCFILLQPSFLMLSHGFSFECKGNMTLTFSFKIFLLQIFCMNFSIKIKLFTAELWSWRQI